MHVSSKTYSIRYNRKDGGYKRRHLLQNVFANISLSIRGWAGPPWVGSMGYDLPEWRAVGGQRGT
jgi:hypothetical protein